MKLYIIHKNAPSDLAKATKLPPRKTLGRTGKVLCYTDGTMAEDLRRKNTREPAGKLIIG